MDEYIYLLIEKQRKSERIISFEKTEDKARKTLHKLVKSERHNLSLDGSNVYSTEDENSVSLFKTIDGYISQGLVESSTFKIQKVSDKPVEITTIQTGATGVEGDTLP